jgi:hypothetical protein
LEVALMRRSLPAMIRVGAAARHFSISSGSPLTMPMMLRLFITAMVWRITSSSVRAAGIGCLHGGVLWNVIPVSKGRAGSQRGITSNGVHIGGGLLPM